MHPNVQCSTAYNTQGKEASAASIDRWAEKDVAHVYNGILLSQKTDTTIPLGAMGMDPEVIKYSEVNQTEKYTYHMRSPTGGIWKLIQTNSYM